MDTIRVAKRYDFRQQPQKKLVIGKELGQVVKSVGIKDIRLIQGPSQDFGCLNEAPRHSELLTDRYGKLRCDEATNNRPPKKFRSVGGILIAEGMFERLWKYLKHPMITIVPPLTPFRTVQPIKLYGVNVVRLEQLMSRRGYEMSPNDLYKFGNLKLVKDLVAKLSSKKITTATDLSDHIVDALYEGLEYNAELGANRGRRDETWHIRNQQAICESFSRTYCAIFEYLVRYHYPQLSSYNAITIVGLAATVHNDNSLSHSYNLLLNRAGPNLSVRIVDPTRNQRDCTRERMPDLIYFLYKEGLIWKEEAIRILNSMVSSDDDHSRICAITNRILINNEKAGGKAESIKMICNYLSSIEDLTHDEINHVLFMPIEDYIIMGNRPWHGYKGSSIRTFATGAKKRANEMVQMLEEKNIKNKKSVDRFMVRIKTIGFQAAMILEKIRLHEIVKASDAAVDLIKLCELVERTRINRFVVQHLLDTGRLD